MLAIEGLGVTSALIEVVVFAVGIAAWVATGGRGPTGGLRLEKIKAHRGDITVRSRSEGPVSAREMEAGGSVDVSHEGDS